MWKGRQDYGWPCPSNWHRRVVRRVPNGRRWPCGNLTHILLVDETFAWIEERIHLPPARRQRSSWTHTEIARALPASQSTRATGIPPAMSLVLTAGGIIVSVVLCDTTKADRVMMSVHLCRWQRTGGDMIRLSASGHDVKTPLPLGNRPPDSKAEGEPCEAGFSRKRYV